MSSTVSEPLASSAGPGATTGGLGGPAALEQLADYKLIEACAGLDSTADLTEPPAAMRHLLGSLVRRWLTLHAEVTSHSQHLKR